MADSNTPTLEGGDAPPATPALEELNLPEVRLKSQTAPSTFSINEFRSEMNINGVMRNNRFAVVLTPPKLLKELDILTDSKTEKTKEKITDSDGNVTGEKDVLTTTMVYGDTRFLTLRCENVSLPGINFFTTDNIRRYGYGQIERRPYLPQFNPITLTFVVDKNGTIMKYFYEWAKSIVNYDAFANGIHGTGGSSKPYFLNYKDDYICKKMNIWMYNENSKQVVQCSLRDAYPLTISDSNLAWGSQDDYVRLSITLQYTDISINFATTDSAAGSFAILDDANKKPDNTTRKRENVFSKLIDNKISDLEERLVNKILNIF